MRSKPIALVDPGQGTGAGVKNIRFSYLFYVDFAASMSDPNAQNALRNLEEMTTYLRVLGSYPMHSGGRR